ncbi:MAG TPA: ion channel [Alphaproteobacteria bacterium]
MSEKRGRFFRSRPPVERVVRLGARILRHRDLYHWFLTLPLPAVAAVCVTAYLCFNVLFAVIYLLEPGGIENARTGSFADAFFFSVQTFATIGYGNMYPKGVLTNLVVTVEAVSGLFYFALIAGLLFARFSQPTARVLFSRVAVVTMYDGVPTLMFRMANERRSQLLQARLTVTLLRYERSPEGIPMWRQRDLDLVRSRSSFFSLSWTVFHKIDERSPLHGRTAEDLLAEEAEVVVLLAGVEEVLSQTVYARHAYDCRDLRWGYRFVDILKSETGDQLLIDMTRFHDVEPAPLAAVPAVRRAAERA